MRLVFTAALLAGLGGVLFVSYPNVSMRAQGAPAAPAADIKEPTIADLMVKLRDASTPADKTKLIRSLGEKASVEEIRAAAKSMVYEIKMPEEGKVNLADSKDIIGFRIGCPDGNQRALFASVPEGYDGKTPMRLLVVLHGGVGNAQANVARGMIEAFLEMIPDASARKDTIIIAPAAEAPRHGADSYWWRAVGTANILEAVTDAQKIWNIDDSKIFLTGMSDGGSGSFGIANRAPDMFAGFFPWVGNPLVPASDDVSVWYENFAGQNIFCVSAGKDTLYPGAEVKKSIDAANAKGAKIEFKLYEEAGHDMTYGSEILPIMLKDHMAKWKRNPYPDAIDYSTDDVRLGRRAWLSVDAFEEWKGDPSLEPHDRQVPPPGPYRARLGVSLKRVEPGAAPVGGIEVDSVSEGGLAESMGIESGDIITDVDGKPVRNQEDLRKILADKKVNDSVKVKVKRDDEVEEYEGTFPPPPEPKEPGVAARVKATRTKGRIDISTWNAGSLSVYTNPSMCDDKGMLRVIINGQLVFAGKPSSDAAFMLREYDRTGDRSMPFCGRIQVTVPAYEKE